MKKLITMAVVAVIVGMTGVVPADYFIDFSSYWGNVAKDGSTPLLPNVGDKATVQLIWAGLDGVANEFAPNELQAGELIAGDDKLLYSFTFENTGGAYENYS